ncbi:hypothetical protein LX99_04235 [Mucilaginibacter oryzae]|uniref:Uncharacterized protein n=1 Tax=Mucilaginibacter oryzae TaxID=468058 RepID=A0A316HI69_9SPHI|nr:hypothetical protein LX99_04235 [Mucilaginibacter oryzae]
MVPTLFTGFRLSPVFAVRSGQCCLFPAPKTEPQDIDDHKNPVEGEVLPPAHMLEDTAAGTGDTLPDMEQAHRDIDRECGEQGQRCNEPGFPGTVGEQQRDDGQFNDREGVDQRVTQGVWKRLEVQLPAEFSGIGELAGSGIAEQEHQQGCGHIGFADRFHGIGV